MQIKINDLSFIQDKYSSKFSEEGPFQWYRGENSTSQDNNVVFFTDLCLDMVQYSQYKNTYNICMLIEPYVINPHPYHFIAQGGYQLFKKVLTHNEDFGKKIPNGQYFPVIQHWIKKEDRKKYPKTKLINIIASSQNFAPGHMLRHSLIRKIKEQNLPVDIMGRGYSPFDFKVNALKDYKFTIAIENCQQDLYFTEKVNDPISVYTIPIYWGPPSINKMFNTEGIVICNSEEKLLEMTKVICSSGHEVYNDSRVYKAVEENYHRDSKYESAEDWIYQNILVKENLI